MPYQLKGGVIAPSLKTCGNCDLRADCQFDRRRMGGFKGEGPKYIGYRIITDRTEQNGAKEDTLSCFNFITSGLMKRMHVGRQQRDDGRDGDLVKIIAQEEPGADNWKTTIRKTMLVGFNVRGEIVKPQTVTIPHLEASGFKVCMDAATVVVEWKDIEYEEPVPKYAEETNRVSGSKQRIMQREMQEQEIDDDADDQAYVAARAKLAEPVAEPVKRKPGRPSNAEIAARTESA